MIPTQLRFTYKWGFVLSIFALLFSGCDKLDQTGKKEAIKNNPTWAQHISAHNRGTISKYDSITIRFVNDVIPEEKVGTDAVGILEVSPGIGGELIFNSKREIILIPEKPLVSGQQYRFSLHTHELLGFSGDLKTYVFDVDVIKQTFEVAIRGVNAQLDAQNKLQVVGTVNTADKEEADKLEKILSAQFKGSPLGIKWQHSPNGRQHSFVIPGIEREANKTEVILAWNGEAIGVDNKGDRKINIPAKGDFKVAHVRVVSGNQQYIEVQLTDVIDPRQNLNGLVQFSQVANQTQSSQSQIRTEVEGSLLKVYPSTGITGEVTITLDSAIKSTLGNKLGEVVTRNVVFTSQKPQVRFAGNGVILPENQVLAIPFEAVNAHSVQVTAMVIYENNIGQFLQDNQMNGSSNLQRVGRYLWRKTIKLESPQADKWNRYTLDATELLKSHPGALFQLKLSINRGNSTYSCSKEDNVVPVKKQAGIVNYEEADITQSSNWDYAEQYYNQNYYQEWENRENPCKDAYYKFQTGVTTAARNFMASNIGLLAKRGEGNHIHLVATDLTSSAPLSGVEIELRNFQNQILKTVSTDKNGFADTDLSGRPFYLVASKGKQKAYLKLSVGSALPISHFDVGGQKVKQGVKGIIYGERGVWRPGDDIFLTFVLEDKLDKIPDQHPVTMELYNAKGQLVESKTNNQPVGDFYKFKFTTAEAAETGTWKVKAILGGNQFTKNLKVETVVPNRLKIDLAFPAEQLYQQDMPLKIGLSSQWLHGAIAAGLNSEVAVRLIPSRTKFGRNEDYRFDDPARHFSPERLVLFEGALDDKGNVKFTADLRPSTPPPGMLAASFNTRVFESGGAFSTHNTRVDYHPYANYVGMRLPKGDASRNMLLTDVKHKVEIASLDAKGKQVSLQQVRVTLYKIDWKWWWDQSGDNLAQYASSYYNQHIQQSTISTKDGRGEWEFEIKYPQWGRYMIRACDLKGNHCTGQVFYIDWPAWAGKAREQKGVGASVLSFSADKPKYKVGETAMIKLPEASQGRALVSIENGSRLISQQWLEVGKDKTNFPVKITEEMSPNVYVSISLIQPHSHKDNDRPIRLFGVAPLLVEDPKTKLNPELTVAEEWKPESKVEIGIKETNGKPMTYTIAVVDEGLLGLTNFRTPNLHKFFYKKEALGVKTWDLFDEVTGAYGGELERLLSLGGDDDAGEDETEKKKRRFPPVVSFLGPFQLEAGQQNKHSLNIPQYLGQVRVMVVAGKQGAYGKTDKSVFIRQPLGLLATLPRVLGPEESLRVPVSLFVMDDSISEVQLKLETDDRFLIEGAASSVVKFSGPGEQIGFINVKVANKLGKGHMKFIATSGDGGDHVAQSDVYIDVRSANAQTTRIQREVIKPGETWNASVKPHGIGDTNKVSLEISAIPPVNLEGRLQYLIRYPHGCLEQTTSAIFPQLFLGNVMQLTPDQKKAIQKHVDVAIQKIQRYQQANGGFNYWPGGSYYNSWSNSYAGHFLVEADRLGYYVPPQLLSNWVNYQKSVASSWVTGSDRSELDQAYRLYTLAVANRAELGAMNRLRESAQLSNTARWLLAASYQRMGLSDVANELVRDASMQVANYRTAGLTFGSNLRDKAIILESLALMKRYEEAKPLADEIANELSADRWYSTQSVAFSLIAMGHFVGEGVQGGHLTFEQTIAQGTTTPVNIDKPVYLQTLQGFPDAGDKVVVKNTSDRVLYGAITVAGIPRAGEERSSRNGVGLQIKYTDMEGDRVDITRLRQGTDLIATVRVRNHSDFKLENLALTHIFPSGWQIHNPRMTEGENDVLPAIDFQDIRDDRVYTYFNLKRGEEKLFKIQLNASFLGHYYLPGIHVEAMYDASKNARSKGKWVDVVK